MAANEAAANARLAQIATSLPEYNPEQLDFARKITAAKIANEAAADATEQARQHDFANAVREAAKAKGIDLSAFDANNVNANTAQANLSLMVDEARRGFMNAETPDEFYARRRNEYMQQGMKKERAMERAASEMQEYRAKYLHAGRNIMYDQGTDNNALNKAGVYYLASMLQDDPQTAALYSSMYAHPVDDYKKNWAAEKAYMMADIANDQSRLRNQLGIEAANNAFNNQRILSNDQFTQALQKMGLSNKYAQENAEIQRRAQIQNIVDTIDLVKQYNPNMTDEEAFAAAISGLGGSKKGTGLSEQIENALGRYEEQESKVANLLKMGGRADKYDVRKAIYELEDSISKIEATKGGQDTAKKLRKMTDQYKAAFKKTYEEDFE